MTLPWHPSCCCAHSSFCVHSAGEKGGGRVCVAGLGGGGGWTQQARGHSRPRDTSKSWPTTCLCSDFTMGDGFEEGGHSGGVDVTRMMRSFPGLPRATSGGSRTIRKTFGGVPASSQLFKKRGEEGVLSEKL